MRSLIWTYLIVSTLAVLVFMGFAGVYLGLEHNPSAVYCDYTAPLETHNYTQEGGDTCRMRAWVFIESGAGAGLFLIALHGPAYVYLLMSHLLRRQTLPKAVRTRVIAAPIVAVAVPLAYLGYIFASLWLAPEQWDHDMHSYCRPAIELTGDITIGEEKSCNINWTYLVHIFSVQFLAIALAFLLPPALRPRLRAIRKTLMQT